jgi:hypothetical protein
MVHLRSYNESAGELYRQVDNEEFESHKDSQQVDTFTKGELQTLFNIIEGTTRVIQVGLYNISGPKMSDIDHLTHYRMSVRTLKEYNFGGADNKSITSYPRIPTNNIYIWDRGLSWQISMTIEITKSCDDYFYVSVTMRRADYYICDGVAGLKSLVVDLFEERKG